MSDSWHSLHLSPAGLGPAECAELASKALDHRTSSMTSLLELHLRAVDAALLLDDPAVLLDQLRWEPGRLETIAPHVDPAAVDGACRDVLSPLVGDDAMDALARMMERAAALVAVGEPQVAEAPRGPDPRVRTYLDRVEAGDRRGALACVAAWAEEVDDVTEVLLGLLQPAQVEMGRAWQEGRVSVAQEHFGTAVAQQALGMLYPKLFAAPVRSRRLVAVTVGIDAHELGLRIVADVLEGHGWSTTYLGTAVPARDVVERLVTLEAQVLAVSLTMPSQLAAMRELVEAVRAEPGCHRVRIVVGGRLVSVAPGIADWLGVDAWAPDASAVVDVCELLAGGVDARP